MHKLTNYRIRLNLLIDTITILVETDFKMENIIINCYYIAIWVGHKYYFIITSDSIKKLIYSSIFNILITHFGASI